MKPHHGKRLEIEYSGLSDAQNIVTASSSGIAFLAVGIEGCESCKKLAEDIADLPYTEHVSTVRFATIDPDSREDVQAAYALRIQDYPTLYAFSGGRAVGGWKGYNHRVPKSDRLAALAALISDLQKCPNGSSAKP